VTQDTAGYEETAARMVELSSGMPGFLGIDSVRGADGLGITVSYWASEADIANWKRNLDHLSAQREGKRRWYERYELRVARVERAYSGPAGR
jgi:heme-degrading monooxygenase HmoA